MDLVVVLAIGVLLVVFLGSLAALLTICHHRYCRPNDGSGMGRLIGGDDTNPILKYSRNEYRLGGGNGAVMSAGGYMDRDEIHDVGQLSPNIARVLAANDWVYDASGLIHHCLAILKICHQITDKLTAVPTLSASTSSSQQNQMLLTQMHASTSRVMPRVDDLVRSMYFCTAVAPPPPADDAGPPPSSAQPPPSVIQQASLLEARAAALVMSVYCMTGLFTAVYPAFLLALDEPTRQSSSSSSDTADWLQNALAEMDAHLLGLRLASAREEEGILGENCRLLFDGGGGIQHEEQQSAVAGGAVEIEVDSGDQRAEITSSPIVADDTDRGIITSSLGLAGGSGDYAHRTTSNGQAVQMRSPGSRCGGDQASVSTPTKTRERRSDDTDRVVVVEMNAVAPSLRDDVEDDDEQSTVALLNKVDIRQQRMAAEKRSGAGARAMGDGVASAASSRVDDEAIRLTDFDGRDGD